MTALVSASTLAQARATLERLHTTTATHARLTETVSNTGGVSKSWSSLGSIQCRVETDMGTMQQARTAGDAPADRIVYEYVVHAAHDADLRTGDRLTLASGITLSVAQASRGQSQGFITVAYCTEAHA